jgi:hypothetical protein
VYPVARRKARLCSREPGLLQACAARERKNLSGAEEAVHKWVEKAAVRGAQRPAQRRRRKQHSWRQRRGQHERVVQGADMVADSQQPLASLPLQHRLRQLLRAGHRRRVQACHEDARGAGDGGQEQRPQRQLERARLNGNRASTGSRRRARRRARAGCARFTRAVARHRIAA